MQSTDAGGRVEQSLTKSMSETTKVCSIGLTSGKEICFGEIPLYTLLELVLIASL